MTDLKYEIYIGARPEKVWKSLFDPELNAKVFSGARFHSTLEKGAPLEPAGESATRVTVVHDQWKQGDPSYKNTADGGWARILSNFKSLIETGKPLELPGH